MHVLATAESRTCLGSLALIAIHPLPQGEREASEQKHLSYGASDTGEKSTNQLFGCTKPFTFGLIARGETSWAT